MSLRDRTSSAESSKHVAGDPDTAGASAARPATNSALQSTWIQRLRPRAVNAITSVSQEQPHSRTPEQQQSQNIDGKGTCSSRNLQAHPQLEPEVNSPSMLGSAIACPKMESSLLFGAEVVAPRLIGCTPHKDGQAERSSLQVKAQLHCGSLQVDTDVATSLQQRQQVQIGTGSSRQVQTDTGSAVRREKAHESAAPGCSQKAGASRDESTGAGYRKLLKSGEQWPETPTPKRLPRLRVPARVEDADPLPFLSPVNVPLRGRSTDSEQSKRQPVAQGQCSSSSVTCSLPSDYLRGNEASEGRQRSSSSDSSLSSTSRQVWASSSDTKSLFSRQVLASSSDTKSLFSREGLVICGASADGRDSTQGRIKRVMSPENSEEKRPAPSFQFPCMESQKVNSQQIPNRDEAVSGENASPVVSDQWLQRWRSQQNPGSHSSLKNLEQQQQLQLLKGKASISTITQTTKLGASSGIFKDAKSSLTEFYSAHSCMPDERSSSPHLQQSEQQQKIIPSVAAMAMVGSKQQKKQF